MDSPQPPRRLFKYCDAERGMQIIRDGTIRFTPSGEFNDPFELLPIISPKTEDLDAMVRKHVDRGYAEQSKSLHGRICSYTDFMKLNIPDQRAWATIDLPPDMPERMRALVDSLCGVLSLTARRDNLIMWAHYAAQHTGCVLGFDTSSGFFQGSDKHLRKVDYMEARPQYQYVDHVRTASHLFQKSLHWESEEEWRLMGVFLAMKKITLPNGKVIHVGSIPPGTITDVYLGTRMSDTNIKKFKSLAAKSPRKLRLFRTSLSRETFSLQFDHLHRIRKSG